MWCGVAARWQSANELLYAIFHAKAVRQVTF